MAKIIYTTPKHFHSTGTGWSRFVQVGDDYYYCVVRRGRILKIEKGYAYRGAVYQVGAPFLQLWAGRVDPSTVTCRTLLENARIINARSR